MSMRGFTLIELLITISITVVLAVAAMPIYSKFQVHSQINESTSLIIQTLRTAKQRSEVRLNNSSHGVWFSSNEFVLYQGNSYSSRDTDYDRGQEVDPSIIISTTLSGGEINFSKSFGEPDNIGTITLTHDIGEERIININSLGIIEEE